MGLFDIVAVIACIAALLLGWLTYAMFGQVGRLLLRVERLERQRGVTVGEPGESRAMLAAGPAGPAQALATAQTALPATVQAPVPVTEQVVQALAPQPAAPESVAAPQYPGFPPATVLFEFELPDLDGRQTLRSSFVGQPVLLIFISPTCRHSRALLADLAALRAAASPSWPLPLLISTGSRDENVRMADDAGLQATILLQEEHEVANLLRVPATPMAYLVDEDGSTASVLVAGRIAILGLAAASRPPEERIAPIGTALPEYQRAFTTPIPTTKGRSWHGLEAGTVPPGFALPRTDGGTLTLDAYRGQRILLVFVDPGTAASDRLAPLLAAFVATGPRLAVLVIGRGPVEENRAWAAAHGLTVPYGVQHHWDVSRAYGLLAAPVAYVVHEQGTIAEGVVAGAEAILELAGRHA